MSKRYTEGIAFDGTAILDNGVPMTITEILDKLNLIDSKHISCQNCKYHEADTYHDKMWCRDCRQMDRFKSKEL